jgi:hypothetical protein
MESTSGFTGSGPDKSEGKGDKKSKRTQIVSRPDLALRFSYQQREVPQPQREAMGRALLDGTIFMRPAGEHAEKSEDTKSKEDKKHKVASFDDIMQGQNFDRGFVSATTKEGDKPKAEPAAESLPDVPAAERTESEGQPKPTKPASFDDLMRAARFDRTFVESTTKEGETPKAELPEEPPKTTPPAHIPPIVAPHEFAASSQPLSPAEQQAFNEVAQEANLSDVTEQLIAEQAARMPVSEAMQYNEDDIFRDLVQQEGAPDPGRVSHLDHEPGYAPTVVAAVGGGETPGFGGLPSTEHMAASSPEDSMPPDAFMPAGNVLRPGGLAGIGALEAQRRLDSLRHRSAEAGLAAGVAMLGLGLIAEHVVAKRRDKKQQKQINTLHKDVKTQGQQLQQEQLSHQQTRHNLDRLRAERATASAATFAGSEAARHHATEQQSHTLSRPEHAVATAPAGHKPEQVRQPNQAPRTEENAGERTEAVEDGVQALEEGARRVRESWYDAVVDREGHVVEGAINYGQGMQQERRSEQLRDRTADTPVQPSGNATQAQGMATSASASVQPSQHQGMYQLPTYNSPALLSGMTTASLPPGHPTREDAQHLLAPPKSAVATTVLKNPWLWAFVGLLLVAFFVASLAG